MFTDYVEILEITSKFEAPLVFSAVFLLAFFCFLRLSNMVPHSFSGFDVSRHLARDNIIFSDSMAIILIKWSKTIQFRKNKLHVYTFQCSLDLGYVLLQP